MRFSMFTAGARAFCATRTTGSRKGCPYIYLLLLLLTFEVKAAEVTIRVASESVVDADRLTLGDIAEVRGDAPATIERLRAINLGYAPSVGTVREIERDRVALALSAAGFSEHAVALTAPQMIYVRRASQVISPNELRTT
ncbi:MAG TPA: hypothetical protein VM870_09355, partial [Pyrinomonadaceae bacterium]|nr:hypothetical protein [Pyrinomonadaceae bacterium]